MSKIRYCVAGTFMGRDISKPGFASEAEAFAYADRKGWLDVDVICEGKVEG